MGNRNIGTEINQLVNSALRYANQSLTESELILVDSIDGRLDPARARRHMEHSQQVIHEIEKIIELLQVYYGGGIVNFSQQLNTTEVKNK